MPEAARKGGTLYRRLSLLTMALLVLGGTLQFLLMFPAWQQSGRADDQRRSKGLAGEIAGRLAPSFSRFDQWRTLDEVYRFTRQNPRVSLSLLDGSGRLINDYSFGMRSPPAAYPISVFRRFQDEREFDAPITITNPADPESEQAFSVAPFEVAGVPYWALLQLESDVSQSSYNVLRESYAMAAAAGGILLAAAATGILAGVILFAVTRRFSRMTGVVREYAAGVFDNRLEVSSRDDELDRHAANLNRMAERIQTDVRELRASDSTRRNLLRAVSRDLSAHMTTLEDALRTLGDVSSGDLAHSAAPLVRHSKALSVVLDELFELARIESKDSKPNNEVFSVEQIIEDIFITKAELLDRHGIVPHFSRERAEAVTGDITWIAEALTAAVEELVRRSNAGGRIDVATRAAGERLEVSMSLRSEAAVAEAIRETSGSLRRAIIAAKLKAHHSVLVREEASPQSLRLRFTLPLSRTSTSGAHD